MALRDLNLVDSLLAQLEEMEAREEDTDRLAELYRLDHLAARLRRNAENLRVLAGRDASETTSDTAALVDVIRAAMSSIDHYSRVTIGRVVPLGVVGFAAEDVGRLLAELLDNATKSSPPTAPVRVGVHLTEQGSALLRVEDEGIGLPPERMRQLNERLATDPVLDDDAVRHMGLAVVRRLAVRHGMRTWLDRRHPHGTTASVLIPAALICELPEESWSGTRTVVPPPETGASPPRPTPPAARDTPLRVESLGRPAPNHLSRNGAGSARPSTSGGAGGSPSTASPASPAPPAPLLLRPPLESLTSGTTASGLPRRVSRSLKTPAGDGLGTRKPPIAAAGDPAAPGATASSNGAAPPGDPHPSAGTAPSGGTVPPAGAVPPGPPGGTVPSADAVPPGDSASPVPGASPADTASPAGAAPGGLAGDAADPGGAVPDGRGPTRSGRTSSGPAGSGSPGSGSNGQYRDGMRGDPSPDLDRTADHARLLADLGAFVEGERAARDEQRGDRGTRQ